MTDSKYTKLFIIAGELGLRLQEILGLKVSNIIFDDKRPIVMKGKMSKGSDYKVREASLTELTIYYLKLYIKNGNPKPDSFLINSYKNHNLALSKQVASKWFREFRQDINEQRQIIGLNKGFGWHALRRRRTRKVSIMNCMNSEKQNLILYTEDGSLSFLKLEQKLIKTTKEAVEGNFYPWDFIILTLSYRTQDILKAFIILIHSNNLTVASSICRFLDENLLICCAGMLVEDVNEFAKQLMKGKQLRDLKDKNKKNLTPKHISKAVEGQFPDLYRSYETFFL